MSDRWLTACWTMADQRSWLNYVSWLLVLDPFSGTCS